MPASFLDYIERKHGLIPEGLHAFEIVPKSARLFDKDGISGVGCKVRITEGDDAGREAEISLILGGKYDGLIQPTIGLLRPWAEAVGADLSAERIQGDFTRLIAALRVAGVGKRVVGDFKHEERKGRKYLKLVSVSVDDEGRDNGPF